MKIRQASHFDFPEIIEILEEFNLDMEELEPSQFVVCEFNESIVGVGRLRNSNETLELSSLGVLEDHRNKGIGKQIIHFLMNSAPSTPIFVVTEIPDYFSKHGFVICDQYPESVSKKLQRCLSELNCSNPVVMKHRI